MAVFHTLAEVTRARQLESSHSGSMVVARADGTLLGVVGDRQRRVFPRSAIKIAQALPLIESGAADHFGFTAEELALACASHSGAPYHVALAGGLLGRMGLDADALRCGAHLPLGTKAQHEFLRGGAAATALHNNCSGKHAGMLATALHAGDAIEDYERTEHNVQRRVRAVLEEVLGCDLDGVVPGIDGCSLPNWPVPLENLGVAFARIVSGRGLGVERNAAFDRLLAACWEAPGAMAGESRLDTEILRRFPGEVFIKTGAEGVYCGGIRSAGIGFALKVDDGALRGAETAVRAIIARFVEGAQDLAEPMLLTNAAGIAVGDVRPGAALTAVLSQIEPRLRI